MVDVKTSSARKRLRRDGVILIGSILLGIILAVSNVPRQLLTSTQETIVLGSLVVGMLFVSLFTAVPASVVLVEMMLANSLLEVAIWATIGAFIGDFIVFHFVEDSLAKDAKYLSRKILQPRFGLGHGKLKRWLMPVTGALIVASPLPDELGLSLMGLSHMSPRIFVPVSLALNFIGILVLGVTAKSF